MQQMVRFLRGDLLIERVQDRVGLRRFDERAAIRFIEALGARLLLRRQSARLIRAADAAVCTRHNLDQIEMLFSGLHLRDQPLRVGQTMDDADAHRLVPNGQLRRADAFHTADAGVGDFLERIAGLAFHHAPLLFVERDVVVMRIGFPVQLVQQPLDDLAVQDRLFQNLFAVLGMDVRVEDALRLNFNQRPHLTIALTAAALEMERIVAALFPQRHARLQPALSAQRRQRFIDRLGFPNMTCRAVADLDDVLALGFQREILEESRHAVHLGDRNAKLARDQLQIALAEIAVLRLNILKNRDQRGLAATMLVDDLHDLCALRFVHLLFPPYITDFTLFTVDKKGPRLGNSRGRTGADAADPLAICFLCLQYCI